MKIRNLFLALVLVMTAASFASAAQMKDNYNIWFRMYCGGGNGPAIVTEEDMSKFADQVITPLFPSGFNVQTGVSGQWKTPNGAIIKETDYIVNITTKDTPASRKAIKKIAEEYVKRFGKSKASIFVVEVPVKTTTLYYEK